MSSTFVALPLPSGESFLLRTIHDGKERVILVDSGSRYSKKKNILAKTIEYAFPDICNIDIAICTHQDSDHANGFRTFADLWYEKKGRYIGEYWLPGRWAAAVPDVVLRPAEFQKKLWSGACEAALRFRDKLEPIFFDEQIRAHEVISQVASEFKNVALPQGQYVDDVLFSDQSEEQRRVKLASALGMTKRELARFCDYIEENDSYPCLDIKRIGSIIAEVDKVMFKLSDINPLLVANMYADALETSKSIVRIVKQAVRWNIPIRWYDFGLFEVMNEASGGVRGLLEPVCAVELKKSPDRISEETLFFSLQLSKQNVESLVFYRPENSGEPGVLFTGDSRLSFGVCEPSKHFNMTPNKPERRIIITSPHHGSRVNDEAYNVIDEWMLGADIEHIYIRNGGQGNQTLGEHVNKQSRRCAQCVQCNGKYWNQQVILTADENNWAWPPQCEKACGTPNT